MKQLNVIIDTDPGVDDAVAIIPALFNKNLNIVLFTTVAGNVDVEQGTKNLLHLLERFKKDIPVAKGASKPLNREAKDAKFLHGDSGLGYYIAPEAKRKPLKEDAVEAMYKAICKYENDITLILIGPHTNGAQLIMKHPDVVNKLSHIIFEGTSAWDNRMIETEMEQHHISFNASCDPEALKIVLESGIPVSMIPSEVGRAAFLTPAEVDSFKENKVIGDILYQMLSHYWEPRVKNQFVATNDTCAIIYALHPSIFKVKKGNIIVDLDEQPGKTEYVYTRKGKTNLIYNLDLKRYYKEFFKNIDNVK